MKFCVHFLYPNCCVCVCVEGGRGASLWVPLQLQLPCLVCVRVSEDLPGSSLTCRNAGNACVFRTAPRVHRWWIPDCVLLRARVADRTRQCVEMFWSETPCVGDCLLCGRGGQMAWEADRTGSGGQSPASHFGGPASIPGQSMSDLWWKKWHWDRDFSQYFSFPLSH